MLNTQIRRDGNPVAIRWDWQTLATIFHAVALENGKDEIDRDILNTGRHVFTKAWDIEDGPVINVGDVFEWWRD